MGTNCQYLQYLSVVIATAALVLGVLNFWYQHCRNKAKLKINVHSGGENLSYGIALHLGYSKGELTYECLAIEIINLSTFKIYISEVGICNKTLWGFGKPKNQCILSNRTSTRQHSTTKTFTLDDVVTK